LKQFRGIAVLHYLVCSVLGCIFVMFYQYWVVDLTGHRHGAQGQGRRN